MAYKIAFYKGTSPKLWDAIQQWAVRIWSRGKYSHCEFIDDNGSSDPNTWTWIAATSYNPGISAARMIEFKYGHWDVFNLPDDVDYAPAMDWQMSNLGKDYDWVGIWLSQFLGLNIDDSDRYFCSEFTMKALKMTALLRGDTKRPESYSPNSMYRKLKTMDELTKWQK